jgi:hypothetical protein
MLRIENLLHQTLTVLKLSGRLQEENLYELQVESEHCTDLPKFDVEDVTLLGRSSVRFLTQCESRGTQLVNCPLYVEEWITRERRRTLLMQSIVRT